MAYYTVTKRYDYIEGWSTTFRQHKAESHCHFIHGYALAFEFTFGSIELNELNWVLDFGGLKDLKAWLKETFDHKTLVAEDDPHRDWYIEGANRGVMDVIIIPATGCEKVAEWVYSKAKELLDLYYPVHLMQVKVQEHNGNSATYEG
jgi:6-pyruvoyltetrahydropterin/6-carboxytetrahydropterin synthase